MSADAAGEKAPLFTVEQGFETTITPVPEAADHGEGPVVDDDAHRAGLERLAADPRLSRDNVFVPQGGLEGVRQTLLGMAVVGLFLTIVGVFVHSLRHALAAYNVAAFTALACCLGSLFWVMVFHAMNGKWSTTIRRQLEHIAGLTPYALLLLGPTLLLELIGPGHEGAGVLFAWMKDDYQGTFLIEHKDVYLNPAFLAVRWLICLAAWSWLAGSLRRMSLEQDRTGDRWLTAAMRRRATFGLLLFTFTVPVFAFDFLMSLDFRFFSTMWGVYYFAGAAMSGVALAAVVLAAARVVGRLTGVVTEEHFHDLGKLVFAFSVFWAYIAFSQYMLIWYSNIPEETAYYLHRKQGGWEVLSAVLAVGHFVVPFMILISRKVKRSTLALGIMSVYLLAMQWLDMVWIVRPMVYVQEYAEGAPGPVGWWLDVAALVGVTGLLGMMLVTRIASEPLVPLRDPRLGACLKHKNYV